MAFDGNQPEENHPLTKPELLMLSSQNEEQLTRFQKLALAVKEANQKKLENQQRISQSNDVSEQ